MAFQLRVKYNATDVTVPIIVVDSTDGTPETGYAYNTAGIDLWYRRGPLGAEVSITEATQTITGAHSDGGVVHVSDGRGRLDLPDAAVAAGVDWVEYGGTITGMIVIGGFIELESASEAAVRELRETVAATSTLTTQTGVFDNTKVNLTGIVDAQSANDLFNGWLGLLKDETDGQAYLLLITDFTNTNLLATIAPATAGVTLPTPVSGDKFWLLGQAALMPTAPGRFLDVSASGEAGVDWANVGTPGSTVSLSGTTVKTATDVETDTADIQTRLPAALVSGRMNSDVVAISGDATAADSLELFIEGAALGTLPKVNTEEINAVTVLGAGTSGNKWRAA